MKVLKFNESYGDADIIKKGLFFSNLGSGYYEFCGTIDQKTPDELINAKTIENFRFKNFSFTIAESIKLVDSHAGSDEVIWLNNWGHLMYYDKDKKNYVGVNIHKMSDYEQMVKLYPDYKLEMLPYFFKESKKEDVIRWFEHEVNTDPDAIRPMIAYVKNSGVYMSYERLKEYVMPIFSNAPFWNEELPEESIKISKDMDNLGFK